MGRIYKQSINAGLLTVLGIILGLMVQILSMSYFPQLEFGFTQNLIRLTSIFAQVGILGFQITLLIKGQTYLRNSEERNIFFTYVLSMSVIGLLSVATILAFCSNYFIGLYHEQDQALIRDYFYLFPILTFISGVLLFLESWLQGAHKTSIATFSKEVLTRIVYILLILLYGFNWINFKIFILSYVFIHTIPLLYLYIKGNFMDPITLNFNYKGIDSKTRKYLWSFSGFHLMATLSLMLIHQMDIILIGPLSNNGLKDVAIYSIAALVINMLRAPLRAIAIAITPSLSEYYHLKNYKELLRVFNKSRINAQLFGVFSCGIIYINLPHLQYFIDFIQTGYEAVPLVMAILLVGQFFEMFAAFNHEIIGISKGYKFNFWIAVFCLIGLISLHFIWIPKWGIYGAAMATSTIFILFNLTKSWYVYQYFKIPLLQRKGAWILFWGSTLSIGLYFIPTFNSDLLMIFLKSIFYLLIFWWIMYQIKASEELVQITDRLLGKKK